MQKDSNFEIKSRARIKDNVWQYAKQSRRDRGASCNNF